MGRNTTAPHPFVARLLEQLGENIRLARLRRNLSAELLAERAGMSRPTLRAIEAGRGGVTMSAYAKVRSTFEIASSIFVINTNKSLEF